MSFGPKVEQEQEKDPDMKFVPEFDENILDQGHGPAMKKLFDDLMTESKPYKWQ